MALVCLSNERLTRVEISVIKIDAAQIHFLSDVFVAVAVVVAWSLYWTGDRGQGTGEVSEPFFSDTFICSLECWSFWELSDTIQGWPIISGWFYRLKYRDSNTEIVYLKCRSGLKTCRDFRINIELAIEHRACIRAPRLQTSSRLWIRLIYPLGL